MSDNSETYVDIVTYRFEWQSGDMGTLLYRDMSDNADIFGGLSLFCRNEWQSRVIWRHCTPYRHEWKLGGYIETLHSM